MPKDNAKSPKAYYNDNKADPTYPFVSRTADELGRVFTTYADPDKPKEAYEEIIHHNGGFDIKQSNDEKGLHNSLAPGESRSYTGGGSSRHSDGHTDDATSSSSIGTFDVDRGRTAGGDTFNGSGGRNVGGSQASYYQHNGTDGESYETTSGNVITHHEGDRNNNTEGDTVNSYVGNKYTIISSSSNGKGVGEYGIHVQDGNMDTQLDNGQYRVASAKDMTFISTTKITIQVGTSSIVMEPGKITITSADVEFVKA